MLTYAERINNNEVVLPIKKPEVVALRAMLVSDITYYPKSLETTIKAGEMVMIDLDRNTILVNGDHIGDIESSEYRILS